MKNQILLIAFCIFAVATASAQSSVSIQNSDFSEELFIGEAFAQMELNRGPEFPGGEQALEAYLTKNIQYSKLIDANEQVKVQFIVNTDGTLTNLKTIGSFETEVESKALEVVRNMPVWGPALSHGMVVQSNSIVPVTFRQDKS